MKRYVESILFAENQLTFLAHADSEALATDRAEIAAVDAENAGIDVAAWLVAANADRIEVVTPCCPRPPRGIDHHRHGVGSRQDLTGRQWDVDDGVERGENLSVAIDMHDIHVVGVQQTVEVMTCEIRRKIVDGGRWNELKQDLVTRADSRAGARHVVFDPDEQDQDVSFSRRQMRSRLDRAQKRWQRVVPVHSVAKACCRHNQGLGEAVLHLRRRKAI